LSTGLDVPQGLCEGKEMTLLKISAMKHNELLLINNLQLFLRS
jgi:hypothetical protein